MNKWIIGFFLIGLQGMNYAQKADDVVPITIWIHGTHRINDRLGIPGIGVYVDHKVGLYKPDECVEKYLYRGIARAISKHMPHEFPTEHFYILCWSGILSHEARLEAAEMLHRELNNLVAYYEKKGKKCIITLITHSHGGNVALNLTKISGARDYVIEKLVLLAVPVQEITQYNVDNDIFKSVFSVYSRWDIIQLGDPQGFWQSRKMVRKFFTQEGHMQESSDSKIPLFSERTFRSKKVKHIEVRHATFFGNRPIDHVEFLLPYFTQHIGSILERAMKYDFSQDADMIFNVEKVSIFNGLFE